MNLWRNLLKQSLINYQITKNNVKQNLFVQKSLFLKISSHEVLHYRENTLIL